MALRRTPEIRRSGHGMDPPSRGYVRIGRGWHMDAAALNGIENRYQRELVVQAARLKVVSRLGDGTAVLRGAAAAFMHGIPLLRPLRRIDITGSGMCRRSEVFGKAGPEVKVRSLSVMGRANVLKRDGIRVVSLEQAMADCALWEDGESAIVAISGILRRLVGADQLYREDKLIDMREREIKNRVCAFLGRCTSRRKAARARRLIKAASARCESPAEGRMLWLFTYWGFPRPRQQARIGNYYVDFLFEDAKLAVEFDGWGKMAENPAAMRELLERDRYLESQGFTVVHVTWRDLEDPANLVNSLRSWFGQRHREAIGPRPRFV